MLRAGTKARIAQAVQEIIRSLQGIQNAKFFLENSTNGRTVEDGYAVFLRGSCLQATAKLWLSMAGKFGWLAWSGLLRQFIQPASIVLGQPLLDGPTGVAGNLHDLRTGQPHLGQVDSLDAPSQSCIGLGTIEFLELLQGVMRFYSHSDSLQAFEFYWSAMTCVG